MYVFINNFFVIILQVLPNFGPYLNEKEKQISEHKISTGPFTDADIGGIRNTRTPDEVPKIDQLVGSALSMIGTYNQLNNREQKVALIDEVRLLYGGLRA